MSEEVVFERNYDFVPVNDKQRLFLETPATEVLYSGAVGAGKTRALCTKGYVLNLLYPGNRGLLVRKEFTTLPASTLKTLLEEVIPPHMVIKHDTQKHFIVHKTGSFDKDGNEIYSEIWYFGLDKKATQDYNTKILSTQWGWIGVDEIVEISETDYDVLKTRLRFKIPYLDDKENDEVIRPIFGATNPDGPMHWLYKKFFLETKKDRLVVLTTAYENLRLPKNYIKGLEESLTGLTRERLLYGRWVQAEGVIYKTFDPAKHVIGDERLLALNSYKYLIAGADSNFPLPRACVLIGVCGDGSRHVIDEFYKTNAYVENLKEWLIDWKKQTKLTIRVYHDPSDPQAISKLNSQGVYVSKANNDVIPGISTVDGHISNGRLFIHKRCIGVLKEIMSYAWDKEREGERPNKDFPDHAMDALRYALHTEKTLQYTPVLG